MADKDAYEEWEVGALYEIAVAAAVVTVTASCKIIAAKKRRMIWVRPIFQKRAEFGAYSMLMAELRENDAGKYQEFTRLTVEDFDQLLSIVKDDIIGSSRFRMPIPPDVRLAVTLRYLATGASVFSAHIALINGFLGV